MCVGYIHSKVANTVNRERYEHLRVKTMAILPDIR